MNLLEHSIVVWDPITNEQHSVNAPPVFERFMGLCSALPLTMATFTATAT
jgi:hypothetical protein